MGPRASRWNIKIRILTVAAAWLLWLSVALACIGPASGADWDRLAVPLARHLGREQGVPPGTVNAIVRDHDGFIWFGTEGGLARWDGYGTRVFRHEEHVAGTLPAAIIVRLAVDEAGSLWVLTGDGTLLQYQKATENFLAFRPDGAGVGTPIGLTPDGKGGIWVDGRDGLAHLDPASGHWRRVPAALVGLPDAHNRGLAVAGDGSLYLARGSSLGRLRGERFDLIDLPASEGDVAAAHDMVSTIAEYHDGTIWFGHGGGVGMFDPASGSVRLVPGLTAPGGWVSSIAELADHKIALAIVGIGAILYDPATGARTVLSRQAVDQADMLAVAADPSGLVFAGSGRGVDLYPTGERLVATLAQSGGELPGLSGPDVSSILERPDGGVWFGLRTGTIDEFTPEEGRIRSLTTGSKTAKTDAVFALQNDGDKGAVAAATETGIWLVDASGKSIEVLANGLPGSIAILPDRDGIWAATLEGGLARFDRKTGQTQHFQHDPGNQDSLNSSIAKALAPAGDGRLWVATQSGLDLFDPATGTARHYRHDETDPTSLPAADVWSLLKDRRGRIWAGTGGGGIGVLDPGSPDGTPHFHHIGRDDGLPHDNIDTMLEDREGRIWVATDDGIAVVDPDRLSVLRRIEPADGLLITNYWENSGIRLADGTLMFGGLGGVSVIRPTALGDWTYRPPIRITEIRVAGRHLPDSTPIVLTPEQRRVSVEFAALDYSAPDQNRYAYRLEGFDEDWIPAPAQSRVATYANLAPGAYRLLIRGSNRAGIWTDPPLVVPISVLPAWYQTLWFRFVETAAAIAALFGIVQLRTRTLRRRRAQLERLVAARTHELAVTAETIRRANTELERLAAHDPLTGLGNRRSFFLAVDALLAQARRHRRACSVLMVDLDHFKRINDTYGHAGGDATLKAAASCLTGCMREIDVVARFGGEEFAAFLPETDIAAALAVAERFRLALGATVIPYENDTIRVTASIGVAAWIDTEADIEPALSRADVALYRVKKSTRNAAAAELE